MRKERGRKQPVIQQVERPHLSIEFDKDFPVDANGFPIPLTIESAKNSDNRPVRVIINNAVGYSEEEVQSKLEAGW